MKKRKNIRKTKKQLFTKTNETRSNGFFDLENIVELSQIVWSIQKFSKRLFSEEGMENKGRALKSNIAKLEEFLKSQQIEIIDYSGIKYSDGMNINIIDEVKLKEKSQEDECIKRIKEMISPTILVKNELIKVGNAVLKEEILKKENTNE